MPTNTTSNRSLDELARNFNYWAPQDDLDDLYGTLRDLRTGCPVAQSDQLGGFWVITTYEDARRVLGDPQTFSSRVLTLPPEGTLDRAIPESLDPPEHGPFRRVFTPWFSPHRVAEFRDRTRTEAAKLAARFVANGGGDFMTEFAVPLPCRIFLEMVGLPLEDLPQLLEW